MPEMPDLLYALNLPPEKVIEYFKNKGYTFSWDWYDTWQEIHTKVFTVAKAMRLDILKDIREEIQRAIEDGTTFQEFKKNLEPRLKAKGWWGKILIEDGKGGAEVVQLGSPWRLRTIYQTNLQTSYMAGRYKSLRDNVDDRPYWQYVAILDSKTRPSHRALHGKVFRWDDPIWNSLYPPNGWGCRCRVRALSEKDIKRKGLKVESSQGNLVKIDRIVSKKTGEIQQVTGYNPETGEITAPDAGWDYNVGKEAWEPDLSKYPPDLVKAYKKFKEKKK